MCVVLEELTFILKCIILNSLSKIVQINILLKSHKLPMITFLTTSPQWLEAVEPFTKLHADATRRFSVDHTPI